MATIGTKKIATTGSDHCCPGPTPAMSYGPPPAPTGPVPTPFAYIALSSSAADTSDKLKVGGDPVLVNGSKMDIQAPGNIPSKATGGDIITFMVNKRAEVFTGQAKVKAGGKDVAVTTDKARLNIPDGSFIVQTIGTLITVDLLRVANVNDAAAKDMAILDPVSVASGAVIDSNADLQLPGIFPLLFERSYSSGRSREHTPFGRGGWTHSYHQFIDFEGADLHLREADGKTVTVRDVQPRQTTFVRSQRIEVTTDGSGGATVRSLDTELIRVFRGGSATRAWLSEIVDTCGHRIRFEYVGEVLARIVDTAGRVVELVSDRNGHIVETTVVAARPDQPNAAPERHPVMRYRYGSDGELTHATNALEETESYRYDERRRLVQKTLANGLSFHYAYDDATSRCIRAWGDGGIHAGEMTYDVERGVTRVTGNPAPRVYRWRPEDGAILAEATTDGTLTLERTYDDDLNLVAAKNAAGDTVGYEYDERGNQLRFTDPGGVTTDYVVHDDLCVRRASLGLVTEYSYDSRRRLVAVRYPTGAALTLAYDEHGRLAAIHGPDGLRHAYTYDAHHNVVEERSARGGVWRCRFDALGRAVDFAGPVGRKLHRDLDALGQVRTLVLPDGSRRELEYDQLGRITRTVDEAGQVSPSRWAGIKSPISIEQPDGAAWQFEYDRLERLQRMVNPVGEAFEFRHDRAGNVREMRTFDGRVVRWSYTKAQRLARVDQPDGTWRSYLYDAAGNVVVEDTPHGSITLEQKDGVVEIACNDPAGRSSVRMETDRFGRVVRDVQNGRAIEYQYDAQNRCTSRLLPTGHRTTYHYDEESRVVAIEHDGHRVELYRDAEGTIVRRVHPGGVDVRRSQDARGRVARDWVGSAAATLVDREYTYSPTSALLSKRDARWGTFTYDHDPMGRLREARTPAGHEAFAYDPVGSLRRAGAAWQVRAGNLLERTEDASYEYDDASRRVALQRHAPSDATRTEYLWDCRSRLREVRLPDGRRVLMSYDAAGRRIRKEVVAPLPDPTPDRPLPAPLPSRVVEYLWEGHALIAEIDSERGVRVFVHEPGMLVPLLQQDDTGVYAVITDHVGTVTELIDASGQLAWAALHSTWGTVVRATPDDSELDARLRPSCPFRLMGQYQDEETGLRYVRYRWFDAAVARFLSPDPLEVFGGPNLMAFNGSPVTHVDPIGLACIILGDPRHDSTIAKILAHYQAGNGPYDAWVHGTSTHTTAVDAQGIWRNGSASQLVDRIKQAGNYDGGEINLNSCNTGRTPTGFAQEVSAGLQAPVRAPNDVQWGYGDPKLGGRIGPMKGMGRLDEYSPADTPNLPTGAVDPAKQYDPTRAGQFNHWINGQADPNNRYRPTRAWQPTDPAAYGPP